MSIPFEIGKLRHRITIQKLTVTQDAAGGTISNWSTFATVWAEIAPLTGREFFEAQQFNADVQGRITIRFLAGVKPEMRVIQGSRIYQILSIIQSQQRPIRLELLYKELLDE